MRKIGGSARADAPDEQCADPRFSRHSRREVSKVEVDVKSCRCLRVTTVYAGVALPQPPIRFVFH